CYTINVKFQTWNTRKLRSSIEPKLFWPREDPLLRLLRVPLDGASEEHWDLDEHLFREGWASPAWCRGGPGDSWEQTGGALCRSPSCILEQVMTEEQLREKLRKITALFEGAATAGERQAAAAAMERLRQALATAVK